MYTSLIPRFEVADHHSLKYHSVRPCLLLVCDPDYCLIPVMSVCRPAVCVPRQGSFLLRDLLRILTGETELQIAATDNGYKRAQSFGGSQRQSTAAPDMAHVDDFRAVTPAISKAVRSCTGEFCSNR